MNRVGWSNAVIQRRKHEQTMGRWLCPGGRGSAALLSQGLEGQTGERGAISGGRNTDWVKSLAVKSAETLMAECRAEHPAWPEVVVQRWCEGKKQLDQNFPTALDTSRSSWTAAVRAIQCPALLVTADPEMGGIISPETAQKIVAMNPRFQVAHIPGVGHHIRFGAEQAYTRAVKDFLAGLKG